MPRSATGRSEADAITIDDDDDECQFAGYGPSPPKRPLQGSGWRTAYTTSQVSTSRETSNSNKRKAKHESEPDVIETSANFTMRRGHAHRFDQTRPAKKQKMTKGSTTAAMRTQQTSQTQEVIEIIDDDSDGDYIRPTPISSALPARKASRPGSTHQPEASGSFSRRIAQSTHTIPVSREEDSDPGSALNAEDYDNLSIDVGLDDPDEVPVSTLSTLRGIGSPLRHAGSLRDIRESLDEDTPQRPFTSRSRLRTDRDSQYVAPMRRPPYQRLQTPPPEPSSDIISPTVRESYRGYHPGPDRPPGATSKFIYGPRLELRPRGPGSVNEIVQHQGQIAVGLNTADGSFPQPTPSYNNYGPTLAMFDRDSHSWHTIDDHNVARPSEPDRPEEVNRLHLHHYSVPMVAFSPTHKSLLVSCGEDGCVRAWATDDDGRPRLLKCWSYENYGDNSRNRGPNDDVVFSSDGRVFALLRLGTTQAKMFVHRVPEGDLTAAWPEPEAFSLQSQRKAGPLIAGRGATAGNIICGTHCVYDVNQDQLTLFRTRDIDKHLGSLIMGGSTRTIPTIDIDPVEGRHLLVVSENHATVKANYVHIIDLGVANLEIPGVAHFKLLKDETGATVSSASMAPDGRSVALGFTDDSIRVYDWRNFIETKELGLVALYRHGHKLEREDSWGITHLAWHTERAMMAAQLAPSLSSARQRVRTASRSGRVSSAVYLFSGGQDGAVRLWDLRLNPTNPKNGVVVAQMGAGIGSFSLGNPLNEYALVVGDNQGNVSVFDNRLDLRLQRYQ